MSSIGLPMNSGFTRAFLIVPGVFVASNVLWLGLDVRSGEDDDRNHDNCHRDGSVGGGTIGTRLL